MASICVGTKRKRLGDWLLCVYVHYLIVVLMCMLTLLHLYFLLPPRLMLTQAWRVFYLLVGTYKLPFHMQIWHLRSSYFWLTIAHIVTKTLHIAPKAIIISISTIIQPFYLRMVQGIAHKVLEYEWCHPQIPQSLNTCSNFEVEAYLAVWYESMNV